MPLFYSIYIDNILIYSNNKTEYQKQVPKVLAKLKEAKIYVKLQKYKFPVEKTTFLGFIICVDGIEMDFVKIGAIYNWEAPKCIKNVQCFLEFANFCWHFIHKYSEMCQPLLKLLKKDTHFNWSA